MGAVLEFLGDHDKAHAQRDLSVLADVLVHLAAPQTTTPNTTRA